MRTWLLFIPLLAAFSGCLNYDPSATAVARDLQRYVKPGFTKADALHRFGAPLAMMPLGFYAPNIERWSYIEGLNSWDFDFDKNGVLVDWRTDGAAAIGFPQPTSPAAEAAARDNARQIQAIRTDLRQ